MAASRMCTLQYVLKFQIILDIYTIPVCKQSICIIIYKYAVVFNEKIVFTHFLA